MRNAEIGGRSAPARRRLAVAIALALPASAALAETALDPVMVTATRRSEDVQNVPVSVSTLSDEKLDVLGSGSDDIRFLSGRLPSLLIESSFGRAFPRFYIRGLGNTDFDLNASQPVSLVYDDVVQENPILKGFPVFDLEMVEMFRGPQGTLFGRNTPAGVLKFNSVRPSREFGGYAQGSYAEDDSVNVEGAVGGPIGENWAFRFSALYQQRGDWVDNAFTGESDAYEGFDDAAGRLQFLYEPSETFSALINIHARSLDGTARMFRANIFVPGTNDLVSGFDPEEVFLDGNNEQELDSTGASLRMSWELGRVTLHSITGYETVDAFSLGDIDGGFGAVFAPPSGPGLIPFTAESADGMPDHSQLTQEFRWESNDWGAFDWQAGIYYFDEDITIDSLSYDTLAASAENGSAVQSQDNQSWAAYGSVEYELSEALTLRGGLRYTDDEKDFSAERFQSPVAFLGATPVGPFSLSVSDEEVTGDISATWSINDGTNLFARIARGYRAPSIQGRILFSASNDPDDLITVANSETILSWEAGVKTNLFGDRGRLSFTVYKYTIDDQQLTAVGGTTNFNRLFNANETDGQGFELDLEAYLTDNLLVTFGASYNDTEISDPNASSAPCGGGCTVLDPPSSTPGEVSLDGNRLPQSPEWIANMTARWGMPMGNGEFFVFTDWAYRSDINFFLYESAEFEGTSLLEGGLRIGYNWNDGAQQLALFGRNITDEIEAVGGIDFNNLTGFINEPRRFGLEFSTRF